MEITYMNSGKTKKGHEWFYLVIGGNFSVNEAKNTMTLVQAQTVWVSKECYAAAKIGMTLIIKDK
jgi:hypothetical protein